MCTYRVEMNGKRIIRVNKFVYFDKIRGFQEIIKNQSKSPTNL